MVELRINAIRSSATMSESTSARAALSMTVPEDHETAVTAIKDTHHPYMELLQHTCCVSNN